MLRDIIGNGIFNMAASVPEVPKSQLADQIPSYLSFPFLSYPILSYPIYCSYLVYKLRYRYIGFGGRHLGFTLSVKSYNILSSPI